MGVNCTTFNTVVTHLGTVSCSSNHGIYVPSGTATISGPCVNSSTGLMAVFCPNVKLYNSPSGIYWTFKTETLGNKTLYMAGTVLSNPAPADVRDGVSYASGSLTGTCKVPGAGSVAAGVPIDNTIGTAVLDIGTLMANLSALVT